jgi:hypothetical protein
MNEIITYYEKTNYGAPAFYIASEHRDAVQTLTKKKTIDHADIKALRALGFSVNQVIDPSAISFMTDRLTPTH